MADTGKTIVLSAAEIAELLGARIIGDGAIKVSGVDIITRATLSDLAFVSSGKNLKRVASSHARLVIVPESVEAQLAEFSQFTFLMVRDPESAFLLIAEKLVPPRPRATLGVSPRAFVANSAVIGQGTNIHPLVFVGEEVCIGRNCDIAPGVFIGDGCVIGDDVKIDANVTLYSDVILGSNITIKASAVIGGPGFGYRIVNGRHERLPHVGIVRIADDVEIGSCAVIDRAKVGETTIDSGTRIDNLVMIAHNCKIGKNNLLCAQTGIAGSSTTGEYVVCAGQAGIADHVHLGDRAIIGGKTGVYSDMPGDNAYLGIPARDAKLHAREQTSLKRLPEMRSTVKNLEKQNAELQERIARLEKRLGDGETEKPILFNPNVSAKAA
jgi:UDP-3-O-[3-hydroxymyristoyl] glucosamine N-acyltransferase